MVRPAIHVALVDRVAPVNLDVAKAESFVGAFCIGTASALAEMVSNTTAHDPNVKAVRVVSPNHVPVVVRRNLHASLSLLPWARNLIQLVAER